MKKIFFALTLPLCLLFPLSASALDVSKLVADISNQANAVAVGPDNYIYTANSNGSVSKISRSGTVATLVSGLSPAESLAFDSAGNLYVGTDSDIVKITPAGAASTFATVSGRAYSLAVDSSNNIYAGLSNLSILKITPSGTVLKLYSASSNISEMAFDTTGNLFVTIGNGSVVKITPSGAASVFASGLAYPSGLVFDNAGSLYVLGTGHIYKIAPDGSSSIFATDAIDMAYAGTLVIDGASNLYFAGPGAGIYQVSPSGAIVTYAAGIPPNGYITAFARSSGGTIYAANSGYVIAVSPSGTISELANIGNVVNAGFKMQIAADAAGNIYVPASWSNTIAKVTPAGGVSTFAILGVQNSFPTGLAIDQSGALYTADYFPKGGASNNKVTPSGSVSLLGSVPSGAQTIVVDGSGNSYTFMIGRGSVYKIAPSGTVTTVMSISGGNVNDEIADPSGNIFVAEGTTKSIYKITPAGAVSTFATFAGTPVALAFDPSGNLYAVGQTGVIWKITPAGSVSVYASGLPTTLSVLMFDNFGNLFTAPGSTGYGTWAYMIPPSGNILSIQSRPFGFYPPAMTKDASGNIYVFDGSSKLYRVVPGCDVILSPSTVNYGTPATLTYASALSGPPASLSFYINNVGYVTTNASSSLVVTPAATTDYAGSVTNGTEANTCPATLIVTPPPLPAAPIGATSANITVGQSATIVAQFYPGGADTITADNIDSPVGTGLGADTSPGTKTVTFTPSAPGTYTFYARATTGYYSGWATYAQTTVTVNPAPSCSLVINPSTIVKGGSASILYTSQNATGFSISYIGGEPPNSSGVVTVSPSASTDYSGTVTAGGVTNTCRASLSVSCTPAYTCSGQTIEHTDASCAVTDGPTCNGPHQFCQDGSSTCVVPPIIIPADGNLRVVPSLVQKGNPAKLFWNVTNAADCSVAGDNGDNWTGLSSPINGAVTSAITRSTLFTLTCDAYTGADPPSITQTVRINNAPSYNER